MDDLGMTWGSCRVSVWTSRGIPVDRICAQLSECLLTCHDAMWNMCRKRKVRDTPRQSSRTHGSRVTGSETAAGARVVHLTDMPRAHPCDHRPVWIRASPHLRPHSPDGDVPPTECPKCSANSSCPLMPGLSWCHTVAGPAVPACVPCSTIAAPANGIVST